MCVLRVQSDNKHGLFIHDGDELLGKIYYEIWFETNSENPYQSKVSNFRVVGDFKPKLIDEVIRELSGNL